MARVEIPFVVQDTSGNAVNGASVRVYVRGTTTPVNIYNAETGGSPITPPITTGADGRINGWVDEGQSLDLNVSATGLTTYTQPWEALRGDANVNVSRIPSGSITSDKIATLAAGNIPNGLINNSMIGSGQVNLTHLAAAVTQLLVPTGVILATGASAAPTGYLMCDGSVVSQTTYSGLYTAIGSAYNTSGEGAGNFRLPDFRGRAPVGVDGGAGRVTANNARGNTGGEQQHTLSAGEMPAHNHTVQAVGQTIITSLNGDHQAGNAGGYTINGWASNPQWTSSTFGSGAAHNNLQPYQIVNYVIKT